jgi:hypothetical protein
VFPLIYSIVQTTLDYDLEIPTPKEVAQFSH